MSEQWENIIENEISFYLNFQKYEEEIQDHLKEVDDWIEFPVTKYDTEQGRVYLSCPGTEEQAIRRITKKDSLNALLERANKRINRLLTAYNQLNEEEQDILYFTYFDQEYKGSDVVRALGFRNMTILNQEKRKVLKKMYQIYKEQRVEAEKEFKIRLQEERKKKANALRNQLYKGAV